MGQAGARPLLVGLTGSIAAGKSVVAGMLRELGAPVVDADEIARAVTAPGAEALARIATELGPGVLDADGALDRAALGRIVFSDAAARARLEAITHPLIIAEAARRVGELGRRGERIVFYEAALLVETGRQREMDRLLVVTAADEIRLERLMTMRGLRREEALARMAAQLPQEAKAALADYTIDNSGSLEHTRAQVEEVWRRIAGPREEHA